MGKNKDLPRGVSYVKRNTFKPYVARHKMDGKRRSKSFKTLAEAIEQRKKWEEKYGKPKSTVLDKDNLLGQRFGKLVVIDEAEDKDGRSRWRCQCDCGNKVIVPANRLKQGGARSCGCAQKEAARNINIADITGQKFGKLTAIRRLDEKSNSTSRLWECRCDCGRLTKATVSVLRAGEKTRCEVCAKEQVMKKNAAAGRAAIEDAKVDGVQVFRFTEKANTNSTSGYKGVYFDKQTQKYIAHLMVNGKLHRKTGFKTAADAYYNGRLVLEDEYLPPKEEREKLRREVKCKKRSKM